MLLSIKKILFLRRLVGKIDTNTSEKQQKFKIQQISEMYTLSQLVKLEIPLS